MEALVNLDAERTVLGCALSDAEALFRALPLLEASDFFLDSHRRIFHVIAELAQAGKPVDELTVCDALAASQQLQMVGGVAFIADLSRAIDEGLARLTNIEHYADLLIDKSRRRQARAAAQCLAAQTENASVTTDEALQQVQDALLRIEAASGKRKAQHLKEVMPELLRELESQASNQGLVGIPTGLHSLDIATGGIRLGELWTIGALPGRGKTALGAQMLLASGQAGTAACAFSLEMQALEIGKRFLAAKSQFSAAQLRNPQCIKRDRWMELMESAAEVSQLPIYVDDRPVLKIHELLASARLYIRRHGVKLFVVDYLRLVDAPGRDLRERVGHVADALRQLAKTERVGVVLLSQLKRPDAGINARPSMLELKESGDIEAHSHVVLLPYLPVADDGGPIPEDQLLIIGKNRNGSVGSLPVYFDEKRLQFVERTRK
ncbi:MAG: replicative DNA helicase [Terriglobales bacterium]